MSKATPTVSVGMPVFNGEEFLESTMESLLGQEFSDFELIVADNASDDATRDIVARIARSDGRVRYIGSDRNRGAAWNFSRLPALANGKYFRWTACDDTYGPQHLQKCVQVLERDPSVSLTYPRGIAIDRHGHVIKVSDASKVGTQPTPARRARSLLWHAAFPAGAPFGLARTRDVLRTNLILPFKGADRIFLLEMSMYGRFQQIDDVLYVQRIHPQHSGMLGRSHWASWWDGGPEGRAVFPRSRLLRGYVDSILNGPGDVPYKSKALSCLPVWIARNASPLLRESVAVARDRATSRRMSQSSSAAGQEVQVHQDHE